MAYIPCVYGGSSGVGIDTLWTNQSPNVNFAAQTISINLSEYDAVFILVKRNAQVTVNTFVIDNDHALAYIPVGTSSYHISVFGNSNYRDATVTTSGVSITAASAANLVIPLMIFGAKGLFA